MDDELKEILNEFLVEAQEMIELLDQRFISLESDPNNRGMLDEIFRAMHSMKGSGGFLGFTHLVDVAHRAENILNKLRQGEMAVTPNVINIVLEAVDTVKLLMADIRETGTDTHVSVEAIAAKLDEILAAGGPATPPAAAAADSTATAAPVASTRRDARRGGATDDEAWRNSDSRRFRFKRASD